MSKHGRRNAGMPARPRAAPARRKARGQRVVVGANFVVAGGAYSHGYSYSADAGHGSATFAAVMGASRWRAALLGTVAAGALWAAAPRAAKAGPDACAQAGGTATCQGDQSDGVASGADFPAAYTTLNVNTLAQDIAPAGGADGIFFIGSTTVTINSDTGPFAIITQGNGADGIQASGPDGVSIHHTGDIIAQGVVGANGIIGTSGNGAVNITSQGNINADDAGIDAYGNGDVTIDHTGDITSLDDDGIDAFSSTGAVDITSQGNINAYGYGLFVQGDGNVGIDHTGDITTPQREGIRAFSSTGAVDITSRGNINAWSYGISAHGSAGVTLDHTGDISTGNADGIFASSTNGTVDITRQGTINSYGDGIEASAFGNVSIDHTGDISSHSSGILQPIGILASSANGAVDIISLGNINAYNFGISAYGFAGVSIDHTGDISSTDADGIYGTSVNGIVDITSQSNINAYDFGIFANGIAGATITHTGDIISQNASGIVANSANGAIDITSQGTINAYDFGIYANGIAGVTIDHTGDVTSQQGFGIYAVSPNGAVAITSQGNINAFYFGIFAAGDGNVTVTHTGDITSRQQGGGLQGGGIFASSATGLIDIISQGNINAYGRGITASGDTGVTINHSGDITSGPRGIAAFSPNGAVDITSQGDISAGFGIEATSDLDVTVAHTGDVTSTQDAISANTNTGSIAVTLFGGTVTSVYAAGIRFSGGVNNTLVNYGTITGASDAVESFTGNETINNYGTITGNVDLGAGTNSFNNLAGGLFNAGATVDMGGGALTNTGTLAPGGAGTIQTTTLTGSFTQDAGGRFAVDVDAAAGTADRLDVSGAAALDGQVVPTVANLQPGSQSVTILTAAGGVTNNGIAVEDTVVVDYELAFPNLNTMDLVLGVSFTPSGLTPNQQATAEHLDEVFGVGGGGLGGVLGYLATLTDFATFADTLDRLHPEPYLAQANAALLSALRFSDGMLSCPVAGDPGAGAWSGAPAFSGADPAAAWSGGVNPFLAEGQCVWARAGGAFLDRDRSAKNIGFEESAGGIAAGVQVALGPDWQAGLAAGYERSDFDVDARAEAEGDVYHLGGSLKYIRGNWLLAGAVTGGWANYDTTRFLNIPGVADQAKGDSDLSLIAGRLRAAYVSDFGPWYLKPLVDLDVVSLDRDAIHETGVDAANLRIKGETDTFWSVAPALEIGSQFAYANDLVARPFVRAGVRFFDEDDLSATAVFEGTPVGVAPFTVTTPLDDVMAEVSAGLDLFKSNGYSLRVAYDGRFGDDTQQHGGSLKLRKAF